MATSRARSPAKKPAPKARAPRIAEPPLRNVKPTRDSGSLKPHLTPTDDPGVFLNAAGMYVGADGVWVGMGRSKETEDEISLRLIGEPVDSPAKLMKRIALDPTLPMAMRLDAAKGAAPYFDKKTPVSVETKNEDFTIDVAAVAKLPREKRVALLKTLKEIGVDINVVSEK